MGAVFPDTRFLVAEGSKEGSEQKLWTEPVLQSTDPNPKVCAVFNHVWPFPIHLSKTADILLIPLLSSADSSLPSPILSLPLDASPLTYSHRSSPLRNQEPCAATNMYRNSLFPPTFLGTTKEGGKVGETYSVIYATSFLNLRNVSNRLVT